MLKFDCVDTSLFLFDTSIVSRETWSSKDNVVGNVKLELIIPVYLPYYVIGDFTLELMTSVDFTDSEIRDFKFELITPVYFPDSVQ